MESGPTLPISIVKITTILPKVESLAVSPSESPTVPNADTVSKSESIKIPGILVYEVPQLWEAVTTKDIKITNNKLSVTTEITFDTTSFGTVRLKRKTSSLPKERFFAKASRTPSVEVLIPPPHEPGDAPVNIKIIVIKSVGLESCVRFIVLYPAVLAVVD